MKNKKHFLAALLSFFMWGFFSLALKQLKDYAALDILFYRIFLSVIVLWVINLVFRKKILIQNLHQLKSLPKQSFRKVCLLNIVGGVLLALNWFVFIYVMNHIGVKVASLAYFICPILTAVLGFFILKEKLNKWQWLSVFIGSVGCSLLSYVVITEIGYSLFIASTYAFYLISQRYNNQLDKLVSLQFQLTITALILLPLYPFYSQEIPTTVHFYALLVCIVFLFTIIPLYLNLYALKGVNSATVGILMYINPILNFLLAYWYFNEAVSLLQWISYAIIFIAIIIFNGNYFIPSKNKLL